ncbi:hypothetical protein [Pseudochelatococcus sp. G4_1912]|uniref:hypothetical protein n=1 Tax=Pseudochelatococcus sp. G4_1912 TaxID=3114288 RepID=UPI0039C60FB4
MNSYVNNIHDFFFTLATQTISYARRDMSPYILFILSVLLYCLYIPLMQPSMVLDGEMWAEMATNYFYYASSPSLRVKLFSIDAGYIPMPQRLIAALGNLMHLSARTIPYFYSWSAIILTGSMVATFCLKPFRVLVKNDYLRFFAVIAILIIADVETRTFINFTYFGIFLISIITALAIVDRNNEVPSWAWFIPLIMISKPAAFAAFPAMIFAAIVSKPRFRVITILTAIACIIQLIRVYLSYSSGVLQPSNDFTIYDKLYAFAHYSLGFLGLYFFRGLAGTALPVLIFIGLGLLTLCGIVLTRNKKNASALIIVGLGLLFFNVLLNVFALSDTWNLDMAPLAAAPLYRHIIVSYFGVILIVLGLICSLTSVGFLNHNSRNYIAPLLFVFWFWASGWLAFAGALNRAPPSPITGNSQWQKMATAIDMGDSLCVPINPLGWIYGRNCQLLNQEDPKGKPIVYEESTTKAFTIEIPPSISSRTLISLAMLIKPYSMAQTPISGELELIMNDGTIKYMIGSNKLPSTGGLLMFTSHGEEIAMAEIKRITARLSLPVTRAYVEATTPAILWLGR